MESGDTERVKREIDAFLSGIPYNVRRKVHSVSFLPNGRWLESLCREVETARYVYIFEFKLVCIDASFSSQTGTIDDWLVKA